MRQLINLTDALLVVEPRPFFRFNRCVLLLVTLALFLYILGCGAKLYQHSYEQTVKQGQGKIALQQAKIRLLEQRRLRYKKDLHLTEELAELRETQLRLEQALEILDEHTLYKKSINYTNYLNALARKPSHNIWLTHIDLQEEYISLEGIATDAEEVSLFLSYLNGLPLFKGKLFSTFELKKTKIGIASQVASSFKLESISKKMDNS